jgi:hypothetical protein
VLGRPPALGCAGLAIRGLKGCPAAAWSRPEQRRATRGLRGTTRGHTGPHGGWGSHAPLAFGRPLRPPAGPLDLLDVDRRRRSLNGPRRGLRGGAAADRNRVACWKCPNEGQVKASVKASVGGSSARPPPARPCRRPRVGPHVSPRIGSCARLALGGWHARDIGRNPRSATRPHAIVFPSGVGMATTGASQGPTLRRPRATASPARLTSQRAFDLKGSPSWGDGPARAASSPGL